MYLKSHIVIHYVFFHQIQIFNCTWKEIQGVYEIIPFQMGMKGESIASMCFWILTTTMIDALMLKEHMVCLESLLDETTTMPIQFLLNK